MRLRGSGRRLNVKLYVVKVRGSEIDAKCWSIRPHRMGVTDPTQVEEVIDLLRQSSMFQKCSKASLQKVSFSCLDCSMLTVPINYACQGLCTEYPGVI
jgi:hypothetical protein